MGTPFTLAPSPKRGALLAEYQQNVDIWTRAAQQSLKQINETLNTTSSTTASASTTGLLTASDWSTFNSKQNALTIGSLTETTSSVLSISGGTSSVVGAGTTIQVKQASASQSGYLSSSDWSTFNSKQNLLTLGNLTEHISSVLTITGGTGSVVDSGVTIQVKQAGGAQAGYLSSADWNSFTDKLDAAPNDGNFYGQRLGDWFSPGSVLLVVTFGEGAGGDENFQVGVSGSENDGRVYFSALDNFQLTDPGSNYTGDGTGTGDTDFYNVPVDGTYQIVTTLRLTDGTGQASSPDAVQYGIGIGGAQPGELQIGSHDYPGFGWASIGLAQRNVFQNIRMIALSAGDHISMVTASPDTGTAIYASDGVMTITLLATSI